MTSVSELTKRMIAQADGNLHDIAHFLKVWAYAKTIGELEGLDESTQFILEAAAITHDIACPLCRTLYGSALPARQEEHSPALIDAFFQDTGLSEAERSRIRYLVAHHHTYSNVDGADYQILLEADYLVNAEEKNTPPAQVKTALEHIFKTASGIALLKSIYDI